MSFNELARSLNRDQGQLKTGIVQYYNGTSADVAIEGSVVTLNVLDSVTLSLGLVVVCSIYGRTGYVIGSLGTTVRAESAYYDGGYGNPNPPDFSTVQTNTTVYSYTDWAQWFGRTGSGTYGWEQDLNGGGIFTTNTGALTASPTSGEAGFYFYGNGAFSELANAIAIQKIELYLNRTDASAAAWIYSHTYGTRPGTTTAPTIANLYQPIVIDGAAWVELPVATFGSLLQTGTFGIALQNGNYDAVGYGQIRVTWTS